MNGSQAALAAAEGASQAIAHLAPSVQLDAAAVLDRSDAVPLAPPGQISANGSCRLIQAADGWIALNLPRTDDAELIPAWIGCDFAAPVWPAIAAAARRESADALVGRGAELGLAVARLGEAHGPAILFSSVGRAMPGRKAVLDLSALWAGPLCAGILAQAGHDVLKVESRTRPDPVAQAAPAHDARLNHAKRRRTIAFTAAELEPLIAEADVIVTSARPRAFAALGLTPETVLARRPGLLWIAITAHGWHGAAGPRAGFGDDAAVAGGLVDGPPNAPRFAGDASADPLTGLMAAQAALAAIARGEGGFIDAALARCAAAAMEQAA